MARLKCQIDGCANDILILSRGLCSMHYGRWQRHGDPLIAPPSAEERERRAQISIIGRFLANENRLGPHECWEWSGYCNDLGYGQLRYGKSRTIFAHRLSFFLTHGSVPERLDHICDNPPCVNPSHLRPATQSQNLGRKRQRHSSSPFRGVRQQKGGRWSATITVDYEAKYLGTFDSAEQAAAVYDRAALEMRGEFARLNVVSP
jgi:hypothetical protein